MYQINGLILDNNFNQKLLIFSLNVTKNLTSLRFISILIGFI
ncbi:hypothetical protein AC062_1675 [Pasteurellaceae bacterium NI1060]|nr:hypothetical protein AC062_1675 [Pasteurellaceae bacterium NI1060]